LLLRQQQQKECVHGLAPPREALFIQRDVGLDLVVVIFLDQCCSSLWADSDENADRRRSLVIAE
jgi:hypothetical protein